MLSFHGLKIGSMNKFAFAMSRIQNAQAKNKQKVVAIFQFLFLFSSTDLHVASTYVYRDPTLEYSIRINNNSYTKNVIMISIQKLYKRNKMFVSWRGNKKKQKLTGVYRLVFIGYTSTGRLQFLKWSEIHPADACASPTRKEQTFH